MHFTSGTNGAKVVRELLLTTRWSVYYYINASCKLKVTRLMEREKEAGQSQMKGSSCGLHIWHCNTPPFLGGKKGGKRKARELTRIIFDGLHQTNSEAEARSSTFISANVSQ